MTDVSVEERVRAFILEEFLEGTDPAELGDDTPLITSGVLDSVGTLTLVEFLEEQLAVPLQAHEADVENLNTIAAIARLVRRKRGDGA